MGSNERTAEVASVVKEPGDDGVPQRRLPFGRPHRGWESRRGGGGRYGGHTERRPRERVRETEEILSRR